MRDAGCPDVPVSEILKCGVELTGHAPISGVFKEKFRPIQVTPEWIQKHAFDIRREVLSTVKPQGDIDAIVMEKRRWTRKRQVGLLDPCLLVCSNPMPS